MHERKFWPFPIKRRASTSDVDEPTNIKSQGLEIRHGTKRYLPERSDYDPLLRGEVSSIRELDLESEEPAIYLDLLRRNSTHFTGIFTETEGDIKPIKLRKFKSYLRKANNHPIVGLNKYGEKIGYAVISDAPEGQRDNWIERLTVIDDLQGDLTPAKTGKTMLNHVLDYAFTTKDYLERERNKIDAAVVMFVPGWERAYNLFFKDSRFEARMVLPKQADVYIPPGVLLDEEKEPSLEGRIITRPTTRFETMRDTWEVESMITRVKNGSSKRKLGS